MIAWFLQTATGDRYIATNDGHICRQPYKAHYEHVYDR